MSEPLPQQRPGGSTSSDARRWQVDRLQPSESTDTIATLARAFHRDPLFDFLVPDAVSQARAALTFMGSIVADAVPFGEIWVARSGTAIRGAAVWLPPGGYPRSARRNAVSLLHDLRSAHRIGRRILPAARLYAEIDRVHHRVGEPHWYLAVLGCDPGWQGRGVGSSLLGPVLERIDREEEPGYLETQKAENVPWYRRHGFEVVEEIRPRGCPKMWAMRKG